MKIIDFHTHTFDDSVAARAIEKLSKSADIVNYLDGTEAGLSKANQSDNILLSVVLPVATKAGQSTGINEKNIRKHEQSLETGILHFGAIHPLDEDANGKLKELKSLGFKGIKLHPVFQGMNVDDDAYLRLIDCASSLGLVTVIHGGADISFPGNEMSSVKHLIKMIDEVHPTNVVIAHMGGWNEWDDVERDLVGADVFLDTSFCLDKLESATCNVRLEEAQFRRIVRAHGYVKVLFGTDSPWSRRTDSLAAITNTGLQQAELNAILFQNAERLL